MKKYAFYVSGGSGRLKLFINSPHFPRFQSQIAFVLSDNPDDADLEFLCNSIALPVYFFDHSTIEAKHRSMSLSDRMCSLLGEYNVDYGFVFGGTILRGQLLEKYELRLINFHPSVLPSFKGLKAIDKAIAEKSFLIGNSAHFIVKDVDSGPVIMQYIAHHSSIKSMEYLLNRQVVMLGQLMEWLNGDRIIMSNGYAQVKDGCYEVREYIPNLEPGIAALTADI